MRAGRKIETYLTVQEVRSAFSATRFVVTKHAVVKDLHPTKGWRRIAHHRDVQGRTSPPSKAEIDANTVTLFEGRK